MNISYKKIWESYYSLKATLHEAPCRNAVKVNLVTEVNQPVDVTVYRPTKSSYHTRVLKSLRQNRHSDVSFFITVFL